MKHISFGHVLIDISVFLTGLAAGFYFRGNNLISLLTFMYVIILFTLGMIRLKLERK